MRTRLTRSSFATDPESLARKLLGSALVRTLDDGRVIRLMISETEAYLGVEDRAAHSFGGRRTPRTEPMFGRPGTSYVYFTYGMHHCLNVVCGKLGEPVAVLLRGGIVVEGLAAAISNRKWTPEQHATRARTLADGPGKLCSALAIDRSLNAIDLTADPRLHVECDSGGTVPEEWVSCTPRIGVAYAKEWAERPLRYFFDPRRLSVDQSGVNVGNPSIDSAGRARRVTRRRA